MKDKFNKLFPCGLDFDVDFSNTALMDRYNELTKEHVEYIENATLHFADMCEMLERLVSNSSFQSNMPFESEEIEQLLKRIDGE